MKHNLKAEMRESMDALHFSQEDKNAMIHNLTTQMKETQPRKRSSRKLMIVAMAAVMLMATLTGAAVFTRWSKTAQNRYNPSEDIKEQAEKSGLSVMLEETKGEENPDEVLSATDQGITITAVQTIVDNYQAERERSTLVASGRRLWRRPISLRNVRQRRHKRHAEPSSGDGETFCGIRCGDCRTGLFRGRAL